MNSIENHREVVPTQRSVLLLAFGTQIGGTVLTAILLLVMPELMERAWLVAILQGACCTVLSQALGSPRWWQAIHLGFVPLIYLSANLPIPTWVWPSAFGLTLAIFWRTDTSRVPLYLTNSATARELSSLLPPDPIFVLDAGCGDGHLLRRLARLHPGSEFVGIEHAPATFAWAWLRACAIPNLQIRYGSFWDQPFTPYDVIYAFLSPVPMNDFWRKCTTDMRPGTIVVSNSFTIDSAQEERVVDVTDSRHTRLHIYRIPTEGNSRDK